MSLAWWQTLPGKELISVHIPKLATNIGRLVETLEKLLPKTDLQVEIAKRDERIQELETQLNLTIRQKDDVETQLIESKARLTEETKRIEVDKWGGDAG
jgi:hypothetical protein